MRLNALFMSFLLLLMGCAGARLSHDDARRKISEIARSKLVPDAIEIRRIVYQGETVAIAETTLTLAMRFVKNQTDGEWQVNAVRLGDNDWIDLADLLAAINEGRRRETTEAMKKLVGAITQYQNKNGSVPAASDIVGLTDILHPLYMSDLIRVDGWGSALDYETTGNTGYRLISKGPDGRRGTPDDIVLP